MNKYIKPEAEIVSFCAEESITGRAPDSDIGEGSGAELED